MTQRELVVIKKLAKKSCANFFEGKCLLIGPCSVLAWDGDSDCPCRYFRKAVLPEQPELWRAVKYNAER